jgi:thiol-disulfide isomerase/thioredoxin
MNQTELGSKRLAKALFAIWMVLAVWLLLRAVIVETAIQSRFLSHRQPINLEDSFESQVTDHGLPRLRSAPLTELRYALAEILLLALGFYLLLKCAERLSTRPWGRRLARPLALVGALTVALIILAPRPQPRPVPQLWAPRSSTDQLERQNGAHQIERPNLTAFFPAQTQSFKLQSLDGQPHTLALARPGRFILIDFWASSCAPCIKAFPTLRALAPELAKLAPIDLVMVSLDRSALAAMNASSPAIESAQYLVMEGKEWDHDIVKAFRITSIPHTLMVLPDGRSYPVDLQNSRWVECVKAVLSRSDAR